MNGTSMFTEELQELYRTSSKIDRATVKAADLDALRSFRKKLPEQLDVYLTFKQYIILRDTAKFLIDEAERVIDLNRRVKEISREIEKARRAERRNAEKEDKTA